MSVPEFGDAVLVIRPAEGRDGYEVVRNAFGSTGLITVEEARDVIGAVRPVEALDSARRLLAAVGPVEALLVVGRRARSAMPEGVSARLDVRNPSGTAEARATLTVATEGGAEVAARITPEGVRIVSWVPPA